jgi:hypothetical protein
MAQTNEDFDKTFDDISKYSSKNDIFLEVVSTLKEPEYSRDCTKIYIEEEAVARVLDSRIGMESCIISARGGGWCTWYIFRNGSKIYFIHENSRSLKRLDDSSIVKELTLSEKYSYSKTSLDYIYELINKH